MATPLLIGIRTAATVRPLGIKNMDMRFFAAGWNFVLHDVIGAFISPNQCGFVPHRSIVQNIIDFDVAARQLGFNSPGTHLPSLLLLDTCAAFPSIAHLWLWRVLKWMCFPTVFIRIFESLLFCVLAMVDVGGSLRAAFAVRGVIQGCPMSATLFLFAFEPFLLALDNLLDATGDSINRACADDIACLLQHIAPLRKVRSVFRAAELAANLYVKPQKCVIIPVGRRCDPATIELHQDPLARALPGVASLPSRRPRYVFGCLHRP